jgi:hypothetical protein
MRTAEEFDKTRGDVAEKVRKLLVQAEDPAATAEEAQAFTMKAQQLMSKYSIELAMITDAADADRLVSNGWTVRGPYASHKVGLISSVARANDCRAIYTDLPLGHKRIDLVGYAADVEWVETLSRSLEVQLAAALADAAHHKPPNVHGRTFAVGFIQGFVAEVSHRLHEARRSAVAAAEAARAGADRQAMAGRQAMDDRLEVAPPAPSIALVLVAKGERVDDEFRARYPGSRTVHSHVRLQSWSGYSPGREAGRKASLARGSVGGTRGAVGRTRGTLSA